MKNFLLTGAILLGSFLCANAQVVWSDNFDDEDIADWTLTDSDGDGNNWGDLFQIGDNQGGFITPVSLISRSWQNNVPLTPNNWAVSPVIDLSAYAGQTITLSWVQQVNPDFPSDKYTVYAGTSGDIVTLQASTVVFTTTPVEAGPINQTLDLSSLAGESTVYVAFRHYDSNDFDYLSIDNLTVTAGDIAGLNNNLASKLSVYPNPTSNIVTVNNNENVLISAIAINDINGRTVKSIKFDGVSNAQINISELSVGIYMMNISSDQGVIAKKIIKN